jgi:nitrate/TMAO reductase-like tetraheme cytochrome c subunit
MIHAHRVIDQWHTMQTYNDERCRSCHVMHTFSAAQVAPETEEVDVEHEGATS